MSERRYGWVMVALGAFMTCSAIGAMVSLAAVKSIHTSASLRVGKTQPGIAGNDTVRA